MSAATNAKGQRYGIDVPDVYERTFTAAEVATLTKGREPLLSGSGGWTIWIVECDGEHWRIEVRGDLVEKYGAQGYIVDAVPSVRWVPRRPSEAGKGKVEK